MQQFINDWVCSSQSKSIDFYTGYFYSTLSVFSLYVGMNLLFPRQSSRDLQSAATDTDTDAANDSADKIIDTIGVDDDGDSDGGSGSGSGDGGSEYELESVPL